MIKVQHSCSNLQPYRSQLCFYGRVSFSATPLEHHLAADRTNVEKQGVGFLEAVTLFNSDRLTFMLYLKPASAESVYQEIWNMNIHSCVCFYTDTDLKNPTDIEQVETMTK